MLRICLLIPAALALHAQESPQAAIKKALARNFAALQSATTKADILRAVDAIDVPGWVSHLPNGQVRTRADALRELETLLAIPPDRRPSPRLDFVYWNEAAGDVTALYWVYSERDGRLTGSLARDTWVNTANGWRRTRHEKFFPDRPLVVYGRAVIAPPLPDHLP